MPPTSPSHHHRRRGWRRWSNNTKEAFTHSARRWGGIVRPPHCSAMMLITIVAASTNHQRVVNAATAAASGRVELTTTNEGFMSLIGGLTARMQCSVSRCGDNNRGSDKAPPILAWYKDDLLLFNGTEFIPTSGIEPSNIVLQHSTTPYTTNNGESCTTDDYTLLLKNLTRRDAGEYRCQLTPPSGERSAAQPPQQLDFRIDVLESGLRAGFHENFTYDYLECCVERGLTPICRSMCKPRDMDLEFFDPTSCKIDDYRNFLHCVTDGGKRDYTPCCRQKSVPAFCFDFCSNNFEVLKRSHRLCLYYLPEFFSCFNKQFALVPPRTPASLVARSEGRRLCWASAAVYPLKEADVGYSIHVRGASSSAASPRTLEDAAVLAFSGGGSSSSDFSNNAVAATAVTNRKTRRRMRRDKPEASTPTGMILLANEATSADTREADLLRVDAKNIERSPNSSEICVVLSPMLNCSTRYIAYVQAFNEHGSSEFSAPLLITTPPTSC